MSLFHQELKCKPSLSFLALVLKRFSIVKIQKPSLSFCEFVMQPLNIITINHSIMVDSDSEKSLMLLICSHLEWLEDIMTNDFISTDSIVFIQCQ